MFSDFKLKIWKTCEIKCFKWISKTIQRYLGSRGDLQDKVGCFTTLWVSIEKSCGNIKSVNICNHRTVRRWLCDILDLKQIINRGVGKISAQPHTIVKQICFPNCNVLFLSLFSLSKNRMHNVVMGCAEILPRSARIRKVKPKGVGCQ